MARFAIERRPIPMVPFAGAPQGKNVRAGSWVGDVVGSRRNKDKSRRCHMYKVLPYILVPSNCRKGNGLSGCVIDCRSHSVQGRARIAVKESK